MVSAQKGPGAVTPPYLMMDGVKECLGSKPARPGASWDVACFPDEQPEECSDDLWKEWTTTYEGLTNDEIGDGWPGYCRSRSMGPDSVAPLYLSRIGGVKECLGSQPAKPGASWNVACFPNEQPEECSNDLWNVWTAKYEGFTDGNEDRWPRRCS